MNGKGLRSSLAKNSPQDCFCLRLGVSPVPWHALRLKHGRSASRLKSLPRAPCFCASSNSLHPPPAAVVLVTSNPVIISCATVKRKKSSLVTTLLSLELITCVCCLSAFQLVLCGVMGGKGSRGSLAKNSPQDCFCLRLGVPPAPWHARLQIRL